MHPHHRCLISSLYNRHKSKPSDTIKRYRGQRKLYKSKITGVTPGNDEGSMVITLEGTKARLTLQEDDITPGLRQQLKRIRQMKENKGINIVFSGVWSSSRISLLYLKRARDIVISLPDKKKSKKKPAKSQKKKPAKNQKKK